MHLLCRDCELRISGYEDTFARRLFHPFHNDDSISVPYEDWLLRFCVSVSWRVLASTMLRAPEPHPNLDVHCGQIDLALEQWRRFLLEEESDVGPFEQHLLPLTTVAAARGDWPPRMNRFFLRDIALGVPMGELNALTYAKLPGFAIYGWIAPSTHDWIGSQVRLKGEVRPDNFRIPDYVAGHWLEQANITWMTRLSARQQDVTDNEIRQNLDRWAASGTYSALKSDVEVFGRRALDLHREDHPDSSQDSLAHGASAMAEPKIQVTVSPSGSVHLLLWSNTASTPSDPPDLDIGMSVRMAQSLSGHSTPSLRRRPSTRKPLSTTSNCMLTYSLRSRLRGLSSSTGGWM